MPTKRMGSFERNLTWWVLGCIAVGIALGQLFPAFFQVVGNLKLAEVNLPVAALIWLMIVPMLLKVDFGAVHEVKRHSWGIGVTLFINWAVKPFSMALLGWLFVRHLFARWLPADQLDSYVAGLILLAAAPCTAMVFVWSNLSDGDPNFTLTQSGAKRRDHAVRIRPAGRIATGSVGHHRAVGDARHVCAALHPGAGHRGPMVAAKPSGQR